MYYDPAIFPAVVFRDFLAMELLPLGLLLRFMIHFDRILDEQFYGKPLNAEARYKRSTGLTGPMGKEYIRNL